MFPTRSARLLSSKVFLAALVAAVALVSAAGPDGMPAVAAPAPAGDDIPLGLNLVPADSPGFVTVNITAMWKNETVMDMIKLLETKQANWRDELKKSIGLDVTNIERVTVILNPTLKEEPVVVVTTAKAFDKAVVQTAIMAKGEERKTAKGKAYVDDGRHSLYFASDRVFAWGLTKWVQELADRPADKKVEGPLANAMQAAAKQPGVLAVNLAAFAQEIKPNLLGAEELKPLEPLFKVKTAFLTIVSGEDTKADLQMTFGTADEAKEGEKAAKAGLELARMGIAMGRQELAQELGRGQLQGIERQLLQRFDALLEKTDTGLKAGEVTRKDQAVNVSARAKINAGELSALAAGALFFVVSRFEGQQAQPAAAKAVIE
jgi:hypothetical protein